MKAADKTVPPPTQQIPPGIVEPKGSMLTLRIPGAEKRRKAIETAFAKAVKAYGHRDMLESRFYLLNAALAMLLADLPTEMHDVTVTGYIRGFCHLNPDLYVRSARTVLVLAKLQAPRCAPTCETLEHYLDMFLELREENPNAAKYYFKAVTLLWPTTVQMGKVR